MGTTRGSVRRSATSPVDRSNGSASHARARGAQVLVLDEPTSALDVHSEAVIQQTLEGLRGRAMVLIIAHRLSTLSICDRILVLREGRVETIGTLSDVS